MVLSLSREQILGHRLRSIEGEALAFPLPNLTRDIEAIWI